MSPDTAPPDERIPLIDLVADDAEIRAEIEVAISDLIDRAAYIGGEAVNGFEAEFAKFCGAAHCVGVANGTDALLLCLKALDLGPGDEVIVPAYTFIATATAVLHAGARPVLADISEDTYCLDPEAAAKAITPRTRAIIPVHLYGHPADMDTICEIAGRSGIEVIEDAAQAHGALYKGRPAGSLARLATFSFYPTKNLGAYGDGGAVLTSEQELAARIRSLANHGRTEHYLHSEPGVNSRLDAIQAAILRVKLRQLEDANRRRRELAVAYTERLGKIADVRLPRVADWAESAWHLYVIRARGRDELMERLRARGVMAYAHYTHPLHLQQALSGLGHHQGDFPAAEAVAREVISLPFFPSMRPEQIERVATVLEEELFCSTG